MNLLRKWFICEETRNKINLVLSAAALIASFFNWYPAPFDPAWIAIILCGVPIVKHAVAALFTRFDLKADLLVSIALVAAIAIDEYFAAGEVAFIMLLGGMLEDFTLKRSRMGIEKLMKLMPDTARRVRENREETIPAESVQAGDILRVIAGETIPVDGLITTGHTSVDQSVLTGESLPVDKEAGDAVAGGTVNRFGVFEMQATKVGEDTSLRKMVRLVESADAGKTRIVSLVDRWATWIVLGALLAATGTWLVTGEIVRAVTILVVFCPCSLLLATPTAIVAAIGNATKFGLLIRHGDALERLNQVTMAVFDKTGTLTSGQLTVAEIISYDSAWDEAGLLELAATAELRSEHPLGAAIVKHYHSRTGRMPAAPERFEMLPGRGVKVDIGSREIMAGNERLLQERQVELPHAQKPSRDGSVIYLAVNGQTVGALILTDTLRIQAAATIAELRRLGLAAMLLSGDQAAAVRGIAEKLGIDRFRADCLPPDKLAVIRQLENGGERPCMIGDGINDAPALKAAHVGIAMGEVGADIAIEAADAVLVGDDLSALPRLLLLARKTLNTIRWNLTLSMALNFGAIALAMTGILNPVMGALVHNVGSIVVILNSARLLKWRPVTPRPVVHETV